jgi:hypothetical protein
MTETMTEKKEARRMRGDRSTHGMLTATLFATGCFSIPPFEPDSGVSFKESAAGGGGGTITAPGLELRFADGDKFHFPNALLIDGTDVMGHDRTPRCYNEDELGFRLVPTARISANGAATRGKNELVSALRGPAVAQAKLDWATGYTCNTMRAPSGASTFTVFPDGRIVRYDVMTDPNSSEVVPVSCACDPNTPNGDLAFTPSTYWTVARSSFSMLQDDNRGALPPPGGQGTANRSTSCLEGNGLQLAFAWPDNENAFIRGREDLVSFGRDFLIGASMLGSYTYEANSALLITRLPADNSNPAAVCSAALARADEHVQPSKLFVNNVEKALSPRDGIYGGDPGNGAPAPIEGSTFELRGPVKDSFAVWLRFDRSVEAIRATRASATGVWYLPQRVDDQSWIVWFKDPLIAGQTILVEPR